MESEGIVVLAILDAVLVSMFFLFRVLPWSEPGPWRLIWIIATLTAALFSLGEAAALMQRGTAVAFEVQGPLFGALLALTACFMLVYLHGSRIGEHGPGALHMEALFPRQADCGQASRRRSRRA